jgi:hypothetical protein
LLYAIYGVIDDSPPSTRDKTSQLERNLSVVHSNHGRLIQVFVQLKVIVQHNFKELHAYNDYSDIACTSAAIIFV